MVAYVARVTAIICGEVQTRDSMPTEESVRAALVKAGGVGEMTREDRVLMCSRFVLASHVGHTHYTFSMERADG